MSLPGQFKAVLKSMNRAFLLQRRKPVRAALQRLTQEDESAVEVLEALPPSDIWVGHHVRAALWRKE
jgi:hypothetical protein